MHLQCLYRGRSILTLAALDPFGLDSLGTCRQKISLHVEVN